MSVRQLMFCLILIGLSDPRARAEEIVNSYQNFVQKQALQFRSRDQIPNSREEWQARRARLREDLTIACGGFPQSACELNAQVVGEFHRDGYRVEKILFQTRPGIWMTANAYVPDKPGKLPAILHVHGHWSGAKQDPVVQSRCIGCAKLGFFVLAVDAFGAGERGIEKKLGQYHGEMTAATLLPVGLPLAGLQIYENRRAVDYLLTRPEVDPSRIGITGASGGGNQTMYAGALDDRLKCVVPTCSVGTYQAYLGAACCLCELIPGGLKFTEEGDILGLAADRGLMVTSATKDAFQFSVGEAKKSVARAQSIAQLFPMATVRHTIIESPHAYNQPMREAMYGWMTQHLKQEGDGSPIPDPVILPEDPEMLRCFPGDSRPDSFVTLPQFAGAQARSLAVKQTPITDRSKWLKDRANKLTRLMELIGGIPAPTPLNLRTASDPNANWQMVTFDTEPGLAITARRDVATRRQKIAMVLDVEGGLDEAWSGNLATELRKEGWSIVAPELRATGKSAVPTDRIANAPDHNSAEWAIWIGRPLIGQWVVDARRTLDVIFELEGELPPEIMVVGKGSAGTVALFAGALDDRITRIKMIEALASYATDQRYQGTRLGIMVPGILRDVGDVACVAALIAPRNLSIQDGTDARGSHLPYITLVQQFTFTQRAYEVLNHPSAFAIDTR